MLEIKACDSQVSGKHILNGSKEKDFKGAYERNPCELFAKQNHLKKRTILDDPTIFHDFNFLPQ